MCMCDVYDVCIDNLYDGRIFGKNCDLPIWRVTVLSREKNTISEKRERERVEIFKTFSFFT